MNYGFKPLVEAAKANGKQMCGLILPFILKRGLRIFQNTVPNIKRELLRPYRATWKTMLIRCRGIGVYDASIALSNGSTTWAMVKTLA